MPTPPEQDPSASFAFTIVSGRDAPQEARDAAAGHARGWVDGSAPFDVQLLVSEVVTNAVKHGAPSAVAPICVEGTVAGRCVGIAVTNAGPPFEHLASMPLPAEPGGRGLALVDALADRWGACHEGGRTTVWFELDTAL